MIELYNLNISDDTINEMIELVPEIGDMTDADIIRKEHLLENIGCDKNIIKNIISSNPFFLVRDNNEILKLFDRLLKYGFNTLNVLFDGNPYILNLEVFEIENYINKRINSGEELANIIDDLDSNPYLFLEI